MFEILITILFSFYVFVRINYSMIRKFICGHISWVKRIIYIFYLLILSIIGFYLIQLFASPTNSATVNGNPIILLIVIVTPLFFILNVLISVVSFKYFHQKNILIKIIMTSLYILLFIVGWLFESNIINQYLLSFMGSSANTNSIPAIIFNKITFILILLTSSFIGLLVSYSKQIDTKLKEKGRIFE